MQRASILAVFASLAFAIRFGAAAEAPKPEPSASPVKIKRTEIVAADNWTVTCTTADQPNAKRRCSAELRIAQTENGAQRVVFTWIVALQDGKPTSVVSAPSGVLIAPGVQMKVGDKDAKSYPFTLCQPDHCEAVIALDEASVKALLSASNADFFVVAVNGASVKFSAALKGFDEAWPMISK